jgi:hypothetical protein
MEENMKKYLFGLVAVAAAAIAWGQPPASSKPVRASLAAEVVSSDVAAKTITVKAPGEMTGASQVVLKVNAKAAGALKGLQAGDRITLNCEPKAKSAASEPQESGAFAQDCASVTSISKAY